MSLENTDTNEIKQKTSTTIREKIEFDVNDIAEAIKKLISHTNLKKNAD